jgi:hypothetical protein
MSDTASVGIVGVIALLVIVGLFVWIMRRRKAETPATPAGAKPDWMRSTPPKETLAALKEDGKQMAVFVHDQGEKLAAPFAEQIEDIVRAKLDADPFLKSTRLDFGTAADGGIEFVINNQSFASLDQIPEGRIKAIIKESIEAYNQQK